jgi:hypothetical protein
MTPVNLEPYAEQAASLMNIPLAKGSAPLVAKQLEILLGHAEAFASFDLPPETTPLPDFIP